MSPVFTHPPTQPPGRNKRGGKRFLACWSHSLASNLNTAPLIVMFCWKYPPLYSGAEGEQITHMHSHYHLTQKHMREDPRVCDWNHSVNVFSPLSIIKTAISAVFFFNNSIFNGCNIPSWKPLLPQLEFTEGLPWYPHYTKPFTHISSFTLMTTSWRGFHLHFKCSSRQWRWNLYPGFSSPRPVPLTFPAVQLEVLFQAPARRASSPWAKGYPSVLSYWARAGEEQRKCCKVAVPPSVSCHPLLHPPPMLPPQPP